jgi:predicted alpha/beta-hydrolase family hydrolase
MPLTTYPSSNPRAVLVLAHGAGAGQKSPFMVRFARGMAERGISAATFDFPYMEARRKVPDRAPVLEARWREAVEEARAAFEELPLFIGGKSMGGRIASHLAAQKCPGLSGLVFLGYPLHPPGKPEQRRDAHLPSIAEPMLFVQGSRDPFGTAAEIAALLPSLPHATLHEVPGGDHSFKAPGGKDTIEPIMAAVAEWIGARSGSASAGATLP